MRRKKSTPVADAIRRECRYCRGGVSFDCESKVCPLGEMYPDRLTRLKRIRAFCLQCVGSPSEVKACTGDILYPAPHKCHMHRYRFGSDPGRRGIGGKAGNPGIQKLKKTPAYSPFSGSKTGGKGRG